MIEIVNFALKIYKYLTKNQENKVAECPFDKIMNKHRAKAFGRISFSVFGPLIPLTNQWALI